MRRRQTLRPGARTPSVQVRTRQTEVTRSLGARACEVAAATSRIVRPWSDHARCFWHTPRGRRQPMRTRLVAERRVLTAILVAVAAPAASAADKVTMAVPGVPPVFSGLVAYVAKEEGFF